ncbi:MAG: hypothetical protein M5U34_29270 [Chloroflexi bacterium]|nr:hypothetical protein [Chloroflexota bacterium]
MPDYFDQYVEEGERPLLSQPATFQIVAPSQARLFLPAVGKGTAVTQPPNP